MDQEKLLEVCCAIYFCAESSKMWVEASQVDKVNTQARVRQLLCGSRQPLTRRDRAVISVFSLLGQQ